jgi:GNAT superfamily N-acetyltransferase
MDRSDLHFDCTKKISAELFIDLLERSGLAERRPVGSLETIAAMLQNANLLCTAWHGEDLLGVARSLTDFAFCCYLSDLAVDLAWQHRGIGRELVRLTQAQLGPDAKIILLAAPAAREYYPKLGFAAHPSAWVLEHKT